MEESFLPINKSGKSYQVKVTFLMRVMVFDGVDVDVDGGRGRYIYVCGGEICSGANSDLHPRHGPLPKLDS